MSNQPISPPTPYPGFHAEHETILLVEDDENDVYFMNRSFQEAGILNPVQVAIDGSQVIQYLSGAGQYADRQLFPMPRVMLLDLQLPKTSGLEVLKWIRQQPAFSGLVVIVLSSSRLERDVVKAYELGANSYLVKPNNLAQRNAMVQVFKDFWLQMNHFPAESQVFSRPEALVEVA